MTDATPIERFDSWDDFWAAEYAPKRRVHSEHKRGRTAKKVASQNGLIFVECVDTKRTWFRVEYPD